MCKNYKNEYLFLLGNGASIASADSKAMGLINKMPSIDNFIDVMVEINQGRWKVELQRAFGEIITDFSYNQDVERMIEILKEKKETKEAREVNISELLDILVQEGRNEDVDKLIIAIFITVISYYRNIHDEYYLKLWEIVEKTKSSVVSLNWDTNFERVIYENLKKEIPRKNYYGKFMLRYLISTEPTDSGNPVVEILKPHGSLNWYFINQSVPNGISDGLVISDSINNGPWIKEDLHANSFLIPPLVEEKWKYWRGYRPRMIKIRNDIERRICECVKSAQTLVIIGYSFPDIDTHIKKLFTDNRFENVWVFDPDSKGDVFSRIEKIFSTKDTKIELCKGGFADIMKWPDVGEGLKPSRT